MPFDPNLGYIPSGQGYAPLSAYSQNFDPSTGQQAPTGGVGANPYPQNRYAFQGPQFQGYGSPSQNLYMGYQPEYMTAIDRMAVNNRGLALAGGQQLQQDLANYSNYNYGQAGNYTDMLNSAYGNIAQGGGGYTDAQKEAILNNQALQGLRMTPEQQQANYLTQEESAQMSGSPYSASDYANQAGENISGLYGNFAGQIGDDLGSQEAAINNTLAGSGQNMRNAIYDYQGKSQQDLSDIAGLTRGAVQGTKQDVNDALGYSQGGVGAALDQYGQNIGNVLGSEQGAVRSYIDPGKLTASDDYMQNYQVGPQDMQGIMNQAGRTVGAQSAMDEENLQSAANAAGNVNPMALQAARNRIRANSAVNEANAMSDAAIKAKQLALTTAQGRENTRLGAEQSYAGLGTGSELSLGGHQIGANTALGNANTQAALSLGNQAVNAKMGLGTQNLSNEQYMGSNTLGQQNQTSNAQLGAEQYLAGQNLAGQQYLGNSRLGNTQQLLGTGMQQGQFNANLGTSALQGAEQQAANRAGTLATNRQGVNQYNQGQDYTRGSAIYNAGSQANLGFANNQQGQEQEYRNYLGGQQQQATQGAQVGNQQRLGAYGATNTGVKGATDSAIENYKVPGAWQAIAGTTARFLGLAKGGEIERGPQTALVGEAGPELIVDIPSYGYGFDPTGSGESDEPEQSGWQHGNEVQGKSNPLWKNIVRGISPTAAKFMPGDTGPDGEPRSGDDSGSKGQGGLGLLKLFMAKGGVVPPGAAQHHPYGKRGKPKAELVTGPQIRTLGATGKQAVVPIRKRPGNRLDLEDLPKLLSGNYGK